MERREVGRQGGWSGSCDSIWVLWLWRCYPLPGVVPLPLDIRSRVPLPLSRVSPVVQRVPGTEAAASVAVSLLRAMDRERVEQRVAEWDEITRALPDLLEQLLSSPAYGLRDDRPNPSSEQHGVYLFTEGGQHLYVGRTGLTERARLAGKPGSSSFLTRLTGHTERDPGSGSFAWRLTMEKALKEVDAGLRDPLPNTRKLRVEDPGLLELFREQQRRVAAMDFRTVEINDERVSYVFELYAAWVLETPYNSFATS